MSAPGPESIPTSADPRSQRPTKKRALTPSATHAASLDALFAKPDKHIPMPGDGVAKRGPIAPEIYASVQGSSSGAGSGEFHVYKATRRREYDRIKEMDDEMRRDKSRAEFETARAERAKKDDEKTRKNREKREKAKARKGKKGTTAAGSAAPSSSNGIVAKPLRNSSEEAGNVAKKLDDGRDGNAPSHEHHNDVVASSDSPSVGLVIHDDED